MYILLSFTCKNNSEIRNCWLSHLVLISCFVLIITGLTQARVRTRDWQGHTSTEWGMLTSRGDAGGDGLKPLVGEQWHPATAQCLPHPVQHPQPQPTSCLLPSDSQLQLDRPLPLSVLNVLVPRAFRAVGGGGFSKGKSMMSAACNLSLPQEVSLGMVLSSPHPQRELSPGSACPCFVLSTCLEFSNACNFLFIVNTESWRIK